MINKYAKIILLSLIITGIFLLSSISFAATENNSSSTIEETSFSYSVDRTDFSNDIYTSEEQSEHVLEYDNKINNTYNKSIVKDNVTSYKTAQVVKVSNDTELVNQLKNDTDMTIELDKKTYNINKSIVLKNYDVQMIINGNGATINFNNINEFLSFTNYHNMTFNNLIFTNFTYNIFYATSDADLKFNNCTFNSYQNTGTSSRNYALYLKRAGSLNVNNCILNNASLKADGTAKINVNRSNINNARIGLENSEAVLSIYNSNFDSGSIFKCNSINLMNTTFRNVTITPKPYNYLNISDCKFSNMSISFGDLSGKVIIKKSKFTNNSAISFSSSLNPDITISDSVFSDNSNLKTANSIKNCTVDNCNFTKSYINLHTKVGSININNCISDNASFKCSGAGSITVNNCTLNNPRFEIGDSNGVLSIYKSNIGSVNILSNMNVNLMDSTIKNLTFDSKPSEYVNISNCKFNNITMKFNEISGKVIIKKSTFTNSWIRLISSKNADLSISDSVFTNNCNITTSNTIKTSKINNCNFSKSYLNLENTYTYISNSVFTNIPTLHIHQRANVSMNNISFNNINNKLIENYGNLSITNSRIQNNKISDKSTNATTGLLILNGNTLVFNNNNITGNTFSSKNLYGLIYNANSTTMNNNRFTSNTITADETLYAGILYNNRGSTSYSVTSVVSNNYFNSTFNAKNVEAGILYNFYAKSTVKSNKFYNTVNSNNMTRSASLVNYHGTMTVKDNDFSKVAYKCNGKIYTRVIYDYDDEANVTGLESNKYSSNNVTVNNMKELQLEIDEVFSDKTVKLKKGTYKLDDYVSMMYSRSPLVIDGQGSTIDGQGKFKFFSIQSDANVTLKNFIIKNTVANDNASAIETKVFATVKVDNCTFINATSKGKGGAIGNRGNMTVTRCTFINNTANTGAAIWSTGEYGGYIVIRNCTFYANIAHYLQNNDRTAVIYTVNQGTNIIEKNVFDNNTGRCIHNFLDSYNIIRNNKFINVNYNYHREELRGGIIDNFEADMSLYNNTFDNLTVNSSEIHGGLIYHEIGKVQIKDNNFTNIYVTATGKTPIVNGAILWNRNATTVVSDNYFDYHVKSSKSYGSGIYNNIGNITVTNNTFKADIYASQQIRGGALFNDYDPDINVKGRLTYGDNDFSMITFVEHPNLIIVNRTVHSDGILTLVGSESKTHADRTVKLGLRLPKTIVTGDTATFTINATDAQTGAALNGTAIIKINGLTLKDENDNNIKVKVVNGQAVLKYALIGYSARQHKVTLVFSKTGYARAETSSNMTVTKGEYGDVPLVINACSEKEITINYTLKDSNGNLLGATNKIAIKFGGKTVITTNIVDGKLNAKFTLPYLPPGKVNVTITLGNNYRYNIKKIYTTATIYKQNVTVSIPKITAKKGSNITIKANLKNKETKTKVISGKYIFKVNGKTVPLIQNGTSVLTTKVVSNGQAIWEYTLPSNLKEGVYDITISYNGNKQSNPVKYTTKALTITG